MSGNDGIRLPEVIVFAGSNGSGKSTITRMAKTRGEYINADDIKRTTLCTDPESCCESGRIEDIGKVQSMIQFSDCLAA